MVGCKIRSRKRKPEATAAEEWKWISGLLRSKFFGTCVDHGDFRKNEKNLFCIDCNLCLCKHCVTSSSPPPHHRCFHRLLQICKYVYRDVVRLHDIQPYLDCSLIQAYKINGEKAVHLNPRPQLKDAKSSKTKGGGTCCEACGRHIQDLPNRFCSIACKVSVDGEEMIINGSEQIPWSEGQIPSLETEENSYENGYGSLTESSEVIQAWWRSPLMRPKRRMLHKRKSLPKRSPLS
ncbi:protein RGF1 INDUCIBLE TRANSCRIPTION FACTOR 1 [Salvia miltiorrhiza]|uniref:protein RGF1 INDUCIBLE TRANSCRIPTION FACTOR 1 n=1 Tax=Salvia miltiorrhiza TaxID=226208 RepID=UPI0025ACA5A6|nr:protein RGF1 INDUCIBLE TRANSCRIPTION FACTOR 1 [Salvia miltiorrhiza]